VCGEPRSGAAKHVLGDLDAVYEPIVADTIQQQAQPDTATEPDIGGYPTRRDVSRLHRGGQRASVAPIQHDGNTTSQQAVGPAELPGDDGQQPLPRAHHAPPHGCINNAACSC
jgi:hypothetical protein